MAQANILQIKRNVGVTAPTGLVAGELAVALDTSGSGGAQIVYISDGTTIFQIGGQKYVNMLDHTPGSLVASSAILVDASSRIDTLNIANNGSLTLLNTGNTASVSIKSPATPTTWTLTLPDTAGSSGEFLSTNGSGVASWISAGTGTLTGLTDTTITSPADTAFFTYNLAGTDWIDRTIVDFADIAAPIVDADSFLLYDLSATLHRKAAATRITDYVFAAVSGDVLINSSGVATIQANSVVLATDTTGDFVQNITAGAGLASTGATTGENIVHSLSVGAGTGITVNADDVQLKNAGSLTNNLVLKWTTTGSQLTDSTITDDGTDVSITGDLRINGNDIKSSTGATAISLSGANVTVAGNLTVSGTTTTVDSTVVKIADPIMTLGGGASTAILDANTDINGTSEVITITGHTFVNDDVVTYYSNGSASNIGLNNGDTYFVTNVAANVFNVSLTQGGANIDLTAAAGAENHTFEAVAADDNKDRGIQFGWHNGTLSKVGFFGYDDSTGNLTYIPDAKNTGEVFSGALGTIDANIASTGITGTLLSLNGDTGTPETLVQGNTITIAGGDGITTVVGATDTVTVTLAAAVAGAGLTYTTGVLAVVGTASRISVAANSIDIDTGYVGQTSITTLGTITTGTWQSTDVGVDYGGTGVSTLASKGVLYGNGTGAVGVTTIAAGDGYFLYATPTTLVPAFTNTIDGGVY